MRLFPAPPRDAIIGIMEVSIPPDDLNTKNWRRLHNPAVRLAAFDLDGTLIETGENRVHPRVQETIRSALETGIIITLATGRSFSFTRPLATALGLKAALICYQGAVIQEMDGRLLRRIGLPAGAMARAVALAGEQDWQLYAEGDGALYLQAGRRYDDQLLSIHSLPVRSVPDLARLQPPSNQMGVYQPDGATAAQVEALQTALGTTAIAFQTHRCFINITPAGVSKGEALAWLAGRLDIPQSEVMAVGDSDNDASMIAWAGVGVAMGNARPSAIKVADWIAPPLEEQGAAAALERFALPLTR